MDERHGAAARSPRWSPWYWLLLLPFPALLWVPSYNTVDPVVFGFPFFYAYQMGWVFVTAALTALVYALTR